MSHGVILPGATLGVLGGGQLGRMFVQAAQAMGYATAVLDADPTSPAGLVSHHHVQTGYLDAEGLARMAQLCDAVTTEFENVPAQALDTAEALRQLRACDAAHSLRLPLGGWACCAYRDRVWLELAEPPAPQERRWQGEA
ncbi:MAG TPA: hypothetical protein PKV17_10720, partial [Aquabacterium sp.]|nr:hypothetical protein [Aquabacterium sp.]